MIYFQIYRFLKCIKICLTLRIQINYSFGGVVLQNKHQSFVKVKVMSWFGIVFFGFGVVVAIDSEEYLMGLLCLLLVVMAIFALLKLRTAKSSENLKNYQPGRGFKFYRKTPEQKIRTLSYAQIFVIPISIVGFIYANFMYTLIGLISALALFQIIKKRITLHTPIDDASLFELEEIGLIKSNEIVQALYKDFDNWEEVQFGNQLLLLTPDSLIVIIFDENDHFTRYDYRLRSIQKLGIMGNPSNKQGCILSLGTYDHGFVRIDISGLTYQDSPEQFLSQFFIHLDRALMNSSNDFREAHEDENKPPVKLPLNHRAIDFDDSKTTKLAESEPPAQNGGRVIDL